MLPVNRITLNLGEHEFLTSIYLRVSCPIAVPVVHRTSKIQNGDKTYYAQIKLKQNKDG